MWKVPFNIDWTEDWGPLDWEELGIKRVDNGSFATKCEHLGDPDVHNGRVYVPLEDCPVGGGESAPKTQRDSGLKPFAFGALGLGAGALIATGVSGALLLDARRTVDEHCPTQSTCDPDGVRAAGSAATLQTLTIVSALTAVAGIGTGVGLLYLSSPPTTPKGSALRVDGLHANWMVRF
jgi:hypothetical protein